MRDEGRGQISGPSLLEVTCHSTCRRSSTDYASDCVDRRRVISKCPLPRISGSRLYQLMLEKYSKCSTCLLIMDSPWGLPPRSNTFLNSSRRADVKLELTCGVAITVLKTFAVKWQKSVSERPKMVHRSPFRSRIWRPLNILLVSNKGADTSRYYCQTNVGLQPAYVTRSHSVQSPSVTFQVNTL